MIKVLSSASKLVFLSMTLASIVGLFLGKIESKDFMILCSMCFSFYFANKGETPNGGQTPQYLGK